MVVSANKSNNEKPHKGYCQRHEEMYFDIKCPKCRIEDEKADRDKRLKYFQELGSKWDEKGWWPKDQ
jgi:hypothetical protein